MTASSHTSSQRAQGVGSLYVASGLDVGDEIEELDTDLTREKNDPGASAYTRLKSAVSSGKRTRVEPVVLKTVRAKEGAGGK